MAASTPRPPVSARIWRTGSIPVGSRAASAPAGKPGGALSHRLDRPDPSGARQLQGEDGQQPDRAGAEDRSRLTGLKLNETRECSTTASGSKRVPSWS